MLLNHTSPQKVAACRVRGVLFEITEHLHRPKSRKSHANRRNHEKKHWYALVPITSPNCSPLFSFPGIGSHKNLRMFQGCFFQRRWKNTMIFPVRDCYSFKDEPLTKGGHELHLAWPWSAEFNWGSISTVPRKVQHGWPFISLSVFLLLGHPTVLGIVCSCAPTCCLSFPASKT